MKRERKIIELIAEPSWTKTDIMRVFNCAWEAADAIYKRARDADERIGVAFEKNKVRKKSIAKATGYSSDELDQIIKKRSAFQTEPLP